MESISVRYGESLTLPIDTGDLLAVTAEIYIGKPGEVYKLKKTATLTEGVGVFSFSSEETKIAIGKYNYQINVIDTNGYVEKYPEPEEDCYHCEDDFPEFIVRESLDEQEIS